MLFTLKWKKDSGRKSSTYMERTRWRFLTLLIQISCPSLDVFSWKAKSQIARLNPVYLVVDLYLVFIGCGLP